MIDYCKITSDFAHIPTETMATTLVAKLNELIYRLAAVEAVGSQNQLGCILHAYSSEVDGL